MSIRHPLHTTLGTLGLILFTTASMARPLVHDWSQHFGSDNYDIVFDQATDPSGDVIIVGDFYYEIDFGGGPLMNTGNKDIFVAKFDGSGNHLWSQSFGFSSNSIVSAIGVTTDASGNVNLLVQFSDTLEFGGGPLVSTGNVDIAVAKFDAAGNHIWSQSFGDAGIQEGRGIATDNPGNVIMTGRFRGTVDFGGGPLSSAFSGYVRCVRGEVRRLRRPPLEPRFR